MRIVSVCRGYPTIRAGGLLHVCQDRALELARQGHQVVVLTTAKRGDEGSVVDDQGVEVRHLPCMSMAYTSQFASLCEAAVKLIAPDILHFDSFDRDRLWWKNVKAGVKSVQMHGFAPGALLTQWNLYRAGGPEPKANWKAMLEEAKAIDSFDKVIAISHHELWQLRDVYGINAKKTSLVYNPICRSFFDNPTVDIPANAPWLCAAISGHGERGFDIAKQACEKAGVQLTVVNNVPRHEMWKVYDKCAGVLLPTRFSQGQDLGLAEALARRRPVITSPTGSYYWEGYIGTGSSQMLSPGFAVDDFVREIKRAHLRCIDDDGSDVHRPEVHVSNWFGAIGVTP